VHAAFTVLSHCVLTGCFFQTPGVSFACRRDGADGGLEELTPDSTEPRVSHRIGAFGQEVRILCDVHERRTASFDCIADQCSFAVALLLQRSSDRINVVWRGLCYVCNLACTAAAGNPDRHDLLRFRRRSWPMLCVDVWSQCSGLND
jgi:hypothetical protein